MTDCPEVDPHWYADDPGDDPVPDDGEFPTDDLPPWPPGVVLDANPDAAWDLEWRRVHTIDPGPYL